jgi:hypothetical protein
VKNWVPNRMAWLRARWAAHPGDPARKAEVVADHRRRAGLTAEASASSTTVDMPSEEPYTAARRVPRARRRRSRGRRRHPARCPSGCRTPAGDVPTLVGAKTSWLIDSTSGRLPSEPIRLITARPRESNTVDPQSESSSHTAVWNSSSRTPRGMSSDASYLPAASPGRRAEESSRKCDQWTVTRRRAVGTTVRQRANASTTTVGQPRLAGIATCPPVPTIERATSSDGGRGPDVVVTRVATELAGEGVGVSGGDDDDRRVHPTIVGAGVRLAHPTAPLRESRHADPSRRRHR